VTSEPASLAAIHTAAFTTPRPWSADEFAALLTGPGAFLCTEPGGFLLGRVIADEAELLTIAVRPEIRQRGLGARLLATFLDEARARGAMTAFLEVAADNAAALRLYANVGFVETGRRPRYYTTPDGHRIDALVLSHSLPPAPDNS
jgi:ribosomal-protein-alanine N-acetyltransferase